MNREHRALLIAMSIGDGYIAKQNSYSIHIEHSQNQLEYLKHKVDLVHSIFGGNKPSIYYRERLDKRTDKVYKQCAFSKGHKYFKLLHRWIYGRNNKKSYTRAILNALTPQGLALWYMDDGWCKSRISKKTGKISSVQTSISTYCSAEEARIICDYFKEVWNINFAVHTRSKTGLCIVCANTTASKEFIELIRPYIIPSMQYKLKHVPLYEISTSASPSQEVKI